MQILALLVAVFASPLSPENLVINSDFEILDASGAPAPWALFVMPNAGAEGRLDGLAWRGDASVMLHNPESYEEEPANNWSQVVITDAASKEIRLTGFVRTEGATEAALWLQCFSQNPARVLAAQTSTLRTPLYGTREWTQVEVQLTAPKNTDFLVVRCVLKGTGKAWFDAIELHYKEEEIEPLEILEPSDEPLTPSWLSEKGLTRDILELSRAIQESIRDLESTNTVLLKQIDSIRREMAEYRERASEEASLLPEILLESLNANEVRHPLVPHVFTPGNAN